VEERLAVARHHIRDLVALKGERRGMLQARSHMGWYLKGMRGAASLRERSCHLTTLEGLEALLEEALSLQRGD